MVGVVGKLCISIMLGIVGTRVPTMFCPCLLADFIPLCGL